MINDEQLAQVMRCPAARAKRWRPALTTAMQRFGITTPRRMAHFLGQLGHESLSLSRTEENLRYTTPTRIVAVFRKFDLDKNRRIDPEELALAKTFIGRPEALANFVYANRMGNGDESSGDGWRFRGRGPIQTTGRNNCRRAGELIGAPLEDQPDLLLDVDIGAMAAAAYWKDNGLNALADLGDVLMVSRKINLGSATTKRTPEGLSERIARTRHALSVLGTR